MNWRLSMSNQLETVGWNLDGPLKPIPWVFWSNMGPMGLLAANIGVKW